MFPNIYICLATALVPMIVGFIWYNPKLFGTVWMNVAGMTEEKIKSGNMPVIFITSYVLSLLLTFLLFTFVVHQAPTASIFTGDPDFFNETGKDYEAFQSFMALYGDRFRSFGHGALHGGLTGLFFVLPIMATNAMFERKGFKYIAVNCGYWLVTLIIMGGILCQWA